MVFDHGLVTAGDENEMLNARLARLIDAMLKHGAIYNGQHFLGDRLGGGKNARAKTRNWKHRFSDTLRHEF